MAAAALPAFERYALYVLAILVVGLYAWGIARTLGAGDAGQAAAHEPAPAAVANAASAERPRLVAVDYEPGAPADLLGRSRLHRSSLTRDLDRLSSLSERKRLFIELVAPLVGSANERVLEQRHRLLDIERRQTAGLAPKADDARWLAALGAEYGVDDGGMAELKARVDIVPPSLALAQAAEESGWGTSRFAVQGNALFGQRIYRGGGGIVPLRRPAGERFRVRAFDDLQNSVSRYVHNLNTHWAYEAFRGLRARMRAAGEPLDGGALAQGLSRYSERGADYIKTIRSIISYNGLAAFDRAERLDRRLLATPGA